MVKPSIRNSLFACNAWLSCGQSRQLALFLHETFPQLKKTGFDILVLFLLLSGLISCGQDSADEIIGKVEKEYEKEYGSNLIMHRERERYEGMDIYRFTGWTVEDDRKYTEINSDEWIIIFCEDKKHQVLKHTSYLPMDSIVKMRDINCLSK